MFFHRSLFQVNGRLRLSRDCKSAIYAIGFAALLCFNITLLIPGIEGNPQNTTTIVVSVESHVSFAILNARVWIEETLMSDLARHLVSVVQGSASLKSVIRTGEKVEANLLLIVKATTDPVDIPVSLKWQTSKDEDYPFYSTKKVRLDSSGPQTYSIGFRIDKSSCIRRLEWHGPAPTINAPAREKVYPGIIAFEGSKSEYPVVPTSKLVYILVMDTIWNSISDKIWRFADDVSATYSTSVWTYSGNDPLQVRNWLASECGWHPNLVGCLFVGDVPEAWYEIPAHPGWSYESFPIDLFYMDVNGVWQDSDADGIYDVHTGDTAPEIWIGRLKASNIGDEVALLRNYFDKNHGFRTGQLKVQDRALSYVDDDWKDCSDIDAVREVYPDTLLVNDPATTTAQDYKSRVAQGYQWVHLMCHGWPGGHVFKIPYGGGGAVYSSDYFTSDWPVLFYNFFVCSGARYTEPSYLAGASIFPADHGLLAVGSTKTGSMTNFFEFYRPLSNGKSVGDAFMSWWLAWMHADSFVDWSYGLTIIGDPTVNVTSPAPITFQVSGLGSDASGTVLTIDGTAYTYTELPVSFTWAIGSTHTVAASDPVYAGSGRRNVWMSWTNGDGLSGTSGTYTVPSSSQVVTANYKTQYYLTVRANPSRGGAVTPSSGWYDAGSKVTIQATPASGWVFSIWMGSGSGSYSGNENSAIITMSGPITETAIFKIRIPRRGPYNLSPTGWVNDQLYLYNPILKQ